MTGRLTPSSEGSSDSDLWGPLPVELQLAQAHAQTRQILSPSPSRLSGGREDLSPEAFMVSIAQDFERITGLQSFVQGKSGVTPATLQAAQDELAQERSLSALGIDRPGRSSPRSPTQRMTDELGLAIDLAGSQSQKTHAIQRVTTPLVSGMETSLEFLSAYFGLNPSGVGTTTYNLAMGLALGKKIRHGETIARGGEGEIFLCKGSDDQVYVTKQFTTASGIKEVEILAKLSSSPDVIDIVGVDPDTGAPILAYATGGNLHTRLQSEEDLPLETKLGWMKSAANGTRSLHEIGYIHRDIKSLNILIDGAGHAKLADFGTAQTRDEILALEDRYDYQETTPWIMPPECGDEDLPFDEPEKIDVWGLGVVFYNIATNGRYPHQVGDALDRYHTAYMSRIMTGMEPDLDRIENEDLRALIGDMLKQNPRERIGMEEVIARLDTVRT